MRSGGGGQKGAALERSVARQFSLWISKDGDSQLWRSAMSGGRATLQLKAGAINRAQSGDLSAISGKAWKLIERYFIEIKAYKDLHIGQALTKDTGNLAAFWRKTVIEAAKYRKQPVLIAKQNRYPTIALVRRLDPLFDHIPPLVSMIGWDAKIFRFDEATASGSPSIITDEVWKPIPGWDEHFVSSLGRVRKFDAVLQPMPSSPRYVYLREGEQWIKESIARLVLLAFIGLPPPGRPLACHLDDDVRNNTIWNVAWGSQRDNALDRYRNGKVDLAVKNARISAEHKGRFMINNGVTSTWLDSAAEIPEGWRKGGLSRRKSATRKRPVGCTTEGKIHITDGTTNRMINPLEKIPIGWRRGFSRMSMTPTEPATEVIRPRIKRPNTPSVPDQPQWSGLDSGPPVRRRRKAAAE